MKIELRLHKNETTYVKQGKFTELNYPLNKKSTKQTKMVNTLRAHMVYQNCPKKQVEKIILPSPGKHEGISHFLTKVLLSIQHPDKNPRRIGPNIKLLNNRLVWQHNSSNEGRWRNTPKQIFYNVTSGAEITSHSHTRTCKILPLMFENKLTSWNKYWWTKPNGSSGTQAMKKVSLNWKKW